MLTLDSKGRHDQHSNIEHLPILTHRTHTAVSQKTMHTCTSHNIHSEIFAPKSKIVTEEIVDKARDSWLKVNGKRGSMGCDACYTDKKTLPGEGCYQCKPVCDAATLPNELTNACQAVSAKTGVAFRYGGVQKLLQKHLNREALRDIIWTTKLTM